MWELDLDTAAAGRAFEGAPAVKFSGYMGDCYMVFPIVCKK